jgi:hypothetical protein
MPDPYYTYFSVLWMPQHCSGAGFERYLPALSCLTTKFEWIVTETRRVGLSPD